METGFPNAMPNDDNSPISAQEAKRLFADWRRVPAIILAVSDKKAGRNRVWLLPITHLAPSVALVWTANDLGLC